MSQMNSHGKCIIFSAPSGAGKTTIVQHLLKHLHSLEFSISACSREPRPNEMDGKDYYFIGVEGFIEKIKQNAFVEWEEVYANNFYGTLQSELERIWSNGHVVIFDVDVVGGLNLKKKLGENALAIFVQPPTVEDLEKRLRFRSTETEEKIQQRLAKSKLELSFANQFDVVLLNDNLDVACNEAQHLVEKFIEK